MFTKRLALGEQLSNRCAPEGFLGVGYLVQVFRTNRSAGFCHFMRSGLEERGKQLGLKDCRIVGDLPEVPSGDDGLVIKTKLNPRKQFGFVGLKDP